MSDSGMGRVEICRLVNGGAVVHSTSVVAAVFGTPKLSQRVLVVTNLIDRQGHWHIVTFFEGT